MTAIEAIHRLRITNICQSLKQFYLNHLIPSINTLLLSANISILLMNIWGEIRNKNNNG